MALRRWCGALLANGRAKVADEAFFRGALEYFLGYYRLHKLDHTTVYEGIPRRSPLCLAFPNGVQRLMAVLSNKPVEAFAGYCGSASGLAKYFVRIYGGNSFATKKPDPLGCADPAGETGVPAEQTLMIGDSSIDVLTGRNAGMWTCGVTGGYGFAPHSLLLEQVGALPTSSSRSPRTRRYSGSSRQFSVRRPHREVSRTCSSECGASAYVTPQVHRPAFCPVCTTSNQQSPSG